MGAASFLIQAVPLLGGDGENNHENSGHYIVGSQCHRRSCQNSFTILSAAIHTISSCLNVQEVTKYYVARCVLFIPIVHYIEGVL